MANDIGSTEGRQVIVANGSHATVIVLIGTAYIQGDVGAITKYFELQVTDPARLAGKWISLIPSDSGYSNVSASVTLKSDFSQIQLEGPYSKIFESISGQNLIAIHGFTPGPSGSAPVRAVLDVTADGTILPVAFEASDGQLTESVTWSDWGDAVTLLAPQKSLPISEIGS
jgi:hypothetical protein